MEIKTIRFQKVRDLPQEIVAQPAAIMMIMGGNGTGKTFLLEALRAVVNANAKDAERVLRACPDGVVTVDAQIMGQDATFTLKLKDGQPVLEVKGADGKPLGGTKDALRRMIGTPVSIRPAVEAATPAKRREAIAALLKSMGKNDADLESLYAGVQAREKEIRDLESVAKLAEGGFRGTGQTEERLGMIPPAKNLSDLEAALSQANIQQARKDEAERQASSLDAAAAAEKSMADAAEKEIARLEQLLADKKQELLERTKRHDQSLERAEQARQEAAQIPAGAADEARAQLENAKRHNQSVAAMQDAVRKLNDWKEAQAKVQDAKKAAAEYRTYIASVFAEMSSVLPEGMQIAELDGEFMLCSEDPDGTLVPVSYQNSADRILADALMQLACSANIVLVEDASLLDKRSTERLLTAAQEKGAQVFMEIVSDDSEVTVEISAHAV